MAITKQTTQPPKSDLVGMYINTLKDGNHQYQGQIIGFESDMCLVQLYSYLSGAPTIVIAVNKYDIMDKNLCIIYSHKEDMMDAFEKRCRERDAKQGGLK